MVGSDIHDVEFYNCLHGTILQGALNVPITFLEVLSYALTVKEEGMMVSTSRPMIKAVLKGYTFNADPLSINTMGTLALMHLMVIYKGLV